MSKTKSIMCALFACLFIFMCVSVAQAVPRTFVSGSGSDANVASNCSFTNPCRFLNAAYGVTDVGGEIIALTTAGYGGLNITTAVTIQAIPGQIGFISVVAGTAGIAVNAGASDLVVIRNFQFSATPQLAAGSTGIQHNSGRLEVQNCSFQLLNIGVDNFAKMDLIDCEVHRNNTGLQSTGTGTYLTSDVAVAQMRINRGNITFNTTGTRQVNAGVNAMMNPLFNILVFSAGGGSTVNIVGNNATNFACLGAGCQAQPLTYTMGAYQG